ncbi:MAG: serine/threonine-protein kinase, partial [Planctomycetota bacterium]
MAITRWFAEVQRIVRPRAEFDGSGDGMADQHPELPLNDATVLSQRPPGSDLPPPALLVGVRELGANLEGTTLGHFHLEKFVGGGGMGAVFRGVDTKLGRIVAVKVLPATATSFDAAAQDTVRRFQNEAQSAARLDHPNIARVYYVGEQESLNYIVFEYIDGENLRDLVANQGPLSLADVIDFTTQLAQALDHAAQRGVVHRDIKPSNVLVTADQRIKLVDMGLARLHQIEAPQGDLTATGVTLGTFDYVSPEQARDPRSADVRSDLYSLGCTLFYMLTGRPPFPDGTVLQKLLSHSSDPPPDVRTFRPDLPAEVNALVQRLLAKQPGRRVQTPAELCHSLSELSRQLGLSPTASPSSAWLPEPSAAQAWWQRHGPWIAVAIALASVVAWIEYRGANGRDLSAVPARPAYPTAAGTARQSSSSNRTSPNVDSSSRWMKDPWQQPTRRPSSEEQNSATTTATEEGRSPPTSDDAGRSGANSPIAADETVNSSVTSEDSGSEPAGRTAPTGATTTTNANANSSGTATAPRSAADTASGNAVTTNVDTKSPEKVSDKNNPERTAN